MLGQRLIMGSEECNLDDVFYHDCNLWWMLISRQLLKVTGFIKLISWDGRGKKYKCKWRSFIYMCHD